MLHIETPEKNPKAINFCKKFIQQKETPRYVLGRNEYAQSIARHINLAGFIDDFTTDDRYLDKPVVKTDDLPENALVINAVVLGRPLTAASKLDSAGIQHLDYFSFYKYSGLPLKPVTFWKDFSKDFNNNKEKYYWIFNLLEDDESRKTFASLINFRLSGDLKHMKGFTIRPDEQYFEDFLSLKNDDESFADVGGYDGDTSLIFISHCPGFKSIYFFEPEEKNMTAAKERLSGYNNIDYFKTGLSNTRETIKFMTSGSNSQACSTGTETIEVDRLDSLLNENITFIKMDIEGAEIKALEGSRKTITAYHPRLAVCVYHKGDDFWKIPELILSFRQDYKIFLRHYTEGVDETVMYFIPGKSI